MTRLVIGLALGCSPCFWSDRPASLAEATALSTTATSSYDDERTIAGDDGTHLRSRLYNPIRRHSTLGMRSPAEFEADHAAGDPDGLARLGARAIARAKKLCTTFGCGQLLRQQQPDSTKPGEVHCAKPSGFAQQRQLLRHPQPQ